jgi:hypothetical protein
MVASPILFVVSAKVETILLTSDYKDLIFKEKYLKYLKKNSVHFLGNLAPGEPPVQG